MKAVVVAVAAALLLAACSEPGEIAAPKPQPLFEPVIFFEGRSEGFGTLHTPFNEPQPIKVQSVGTTRSGGRLNLVQRIAEGDKPPRLRRWIMIPRSTKSWTGSLTDAAGPVSVEARGNSATIRYTMKNGFDVEQQLRLQSDRRTLANQLIVRKWGVRVAWLDETIRKLD